MKYLFIVTILCLIGCKQNAEIPADNNAAEKPKKHRSIIPEPPKFTLPPNAKFESRVASIYYDTGVEKVYDTLQVRVYTLDTAKVFLYGDKDSFNDTLILSKNSGSFRGNRDWGHGYTKFKKQKKFLYNGKTIFINKYFARAGRSLLNIYTNDSLGIILLTGSGHIGRHRNIFYNKNIFSDLQKSIIKDSLFFEFELTW